VADGTRLERLATMTRMLLVGLVASALAAAGNPHLEAQAVGPPAAAPASRPQPAGGSAAVPSRALLDQYCITCHNEKLKTAGLMLDKVDVADVKGNAEILEKVVRKLRSGQMPPEGPPRPDQTTVDRFATALEAALDRVASAAPNPGRVASHRLNRAEYVNVIHDLLDLDIDGTQLLPSDTSGFGFDNNAEVLSITPGLMGRYMSAATKISRLALASPDNRPIMQVYTVGFAKQDARMSEQMPFATHGGLAVRHPFPLDGEYVFRLHLKRNVTVLNILGIEEDEHQIEVRVDHALVKRFKVGGRFKGPDPGVLIAVPEEDADGARVHDYRMNADKELEIRVPIKGGVRLVSAAFTDVKPALLEGVPERPQSLKGSGGGSEIGIDALDIAGPFDAKPAENTPSRRRIFVCRPATAHDEEGCAGRILGDLAGRAYRRPVTDTDLQPLLKLYAAGRRDRDFDAGIERAIEAMLSSPAFLFRIELDPADAKPSSIYRVSDLELASRLSFFLWKSIPDHELIEVASRGRLKDPQVFTQQVRRMIADRRATRFMNDFLEQWLQVRNIYAQDPDPALFPEFDDTLREAMVRETELFFESQVREDRPIPELLRATYSYLNERLARHYGIPDVYGSHFRRVVLTDERRFGLLGHASVLTVSSYAHRTSVVLRGKWILENLLGAPPPPPPPNVPPLKENDGKAKPTSLRARMEEHRKNAVCAACHSRMDPMGFALEHFDAIGTWRDDDGGAEINSTITLSGVTIDSPKAFREALLGRGNEFLRTVTEKLLTYALGRGVESADAPAVRQLVREMRRDDFRWSSLILGIVQSGPFQMRRTLDPNRSGPAAATVASR
jgi:cytochrome c5